MNCNRHLQLLKGRLENHKSRAGQTRLSFWLNFGNICILLSSGFSLVTQEAEWGDSDSFLTHAQSWLCPSFSLAQVLIFQDLKFRSQGCSDGNKDQPTSFIPKPLGADSQGRPLLLANSGPVPPLLPVTLEWKTEHGFMVVLPGLHRADWETMTSWANGELRLPPPFLLLLNCWHCEISGANHGVRDLLMVWRRTAHVQCSS